MWQEKILLLVNNFLAEFEGLIRPLKARQGKDEFPGKGRVYGQVRRSETLLHNW